METEIRTFPLEDFDLREEADGLNFRGYAAVFNSFSDDLGGFRESITPGAFKTSINAAANGKRAIKMFLNHNQDIVLASTKAKTLRLSEDEKGLVSEARLPNSDMGRYASEAIRRGDIDSMSFGFNVLRDEWSGDHSERNLLDVKLWEVSPVTGWPAYAATTASVRSIAEAVGEDEAELREAVKTLFAEDTKLTAEQRDLLVRAINARTDGPVVPQRIATRLAALEAKMAAAPKYEPSAS